MTDRLGRVFRVKKTLDVFVPYTQELAMVLHADDIVTIVNRERDFIDHSIVTFRAGVPVKGGYMAITGSGSVVSLGILSDGVWHEYFEDVSP